VSIRVGYDATVTDCTIVDPPPPSSNTAADAAWMPGFARKALLCGTTATFAIISIPSAHLTAAGERAFAIKICIARPDVSTAMRDAALWLKEAP
jgi:hypothetical protein